MRPDLQVEDAAGVRARIADVEGCGLLAAVAVQNETLARSPSPRILFDPKY